MESFTKTALKLFRGKQSPFVGNEAPNDELLEQIEEAILSRETLQATFSGRNSRSLVQFDSSDIQDDNYTSAGAEVTETVSEDQHAIVAEDGLAASSGATDGSATAPLNASATLEQNANLSANEQNTQVPLSESAFAPILRKEIAPVNPKNSRTKVSKSLSTEMTDESTRQASVDDGGVRDCSIAPVTTSESVQISSFEQTSISVTEKGIVLTRMKVNNWL